MIKVVVEVEITPDTFLDGGMAWVEEFADKGREMGEVTLCKISGIPSELYVVGNPS